MAGKRAEIIETAAGLIESYGYENTRVNDILDACGIGKGQFYYYFESKRALGLAVIEYFFASFQNNMLESILSSDLQPEEKLRAMLEWIIAFHEKKEVKCGCVFGNLALEMSEHDPEFREALNRVFAAWSDKLRLVLLELLEPGPSAAGEAKALAQAIVGMIEGGILLMKNHQDINVLRDMGDWILYLVRSYRMNPAKADIFKTIETGGCMK